MKTLTRTLLRFTLGCFVVTIGDNTWAQGGGWTALSTNGAPSPRCFHTAIWTGSEMIIWGGRSNSTYLNTGARYHPVSNTWTAITNTGAPTARAGPACPLTHAWAERSAWRFDGRPAAGRH